MRVAAVLGQVIDTVHDVGGHCKAGLKAMPLSRGAKCHSEVFIELMAPLEDQLFDGGFGFAIHKASR
jgi:hypothetical protein